MRLLKLIRKLFPTRKHNSIKAYDAFSYKIVRHQTCQKSLQCERQYNFYFIYFLFFKTERINVYTLTFKYNLVVELRDVCTAGKFMCFLLTLGKRVHGWLTIVNVSNVIPCLNNTVQFHNHDIGILYPQLVPLQHPQVYHDV